MATIADLLVKISADTSQFRKEIEASQRQLQRTFGSQALGLSKKLLTGLTALGAGMVGVGVASVKLAGDMRATEKSFEVLLGSADTAKKMMADLTQFASSTPFSLSGLSDAARQLLAFGYQAKDVKPILQAAGDAAALMGKGTQGVNQITLALSQMQAKGKLAGQEMLQLANSGINGYKYVAEAMGMTEQQAREKISKGQIDAGQGLTAIVKGMQKEFSGGMESLSQEIPGMWSTIKDNVNLSLVAIGKNLTDAFNIKGKLSAAMEWLQKFTTSLNEGGIAAAFFGNTSEGARAGMILLAGAITGIVVPALVLAGGSAAVALVPFLPFIAIGVGIAAAGLLIYRNWDSLKKLFISFKPVLSVIFAPLVLSIKGVIAIGKLLYNNWDKILSLFKFIFDYLKNAIANRVTEIEIIVAEIGRIALKAKAFVVGIFDSAASAAVNKELQKVEDHLASLKKRAIELAATKPVIQDYFNTISENAKMASASVNGLTGALMGAAAIQKGLEAAKEAADWKIESKGSAGDKDDKGKAAKKLAAEIKDALDAVKQLNSSWRTLMTDIQRGSLTGAELFRFDQQNQLDTAINKLKDDFDDLTERFNSSTEKQKEIYRKWLNDKGIMYAETEKGLLDLTAERLKREAEMEQNHRAQVQRDERANKEILAEIDAAKYEGDMARLIEYLDAEKAARLAHLEGVQGLMDVYLEARKAQMADEYALMASVYGEFYSGLSSTMSDIIMQTQTAAEAFKALGKSMLKTVVDFVAKKITGMIAAEAMAAILSKKQTALSLTQAAVTAKAWAKAAAMVSLATSGANAGPAMAGILATVTLADSLAIPGLAKGGIVTGPTTALIGEGRYNEAVLPLNKQYLERVGLVQDSAPVVNAVQNNYGDINTDVDFDDLQTAFGSMLQSALKVA